MLFLPQKHEITAMCNPTFLRRLARVSVLFLICLSSSYVPAVVLNLPGGIRYTVSDNIKPEHLRTFSQTHATAGEKDKDQSDQETINVILFNHLGYAKFSERKPRPEGEGTLYVSIIATGGESPATDLGIQLSKSEDTMFNHPSVAHSKTMTVSKFMGGHIAGHVVPTESGSRLAFQDQEPMITLPSASDKSYVFSAKVDDVDYQDLNLLSPTISIQGESFRLSHGGAMPALPEHNVVVIFHFVPHAGVSEVSIHMTQPSASSAGSERALTVMDIQDIANLMTFDRLAAVLRKGQIDESFIEQKKASHAANLTEGCVKLLTEEQSRMGDGFTAEYLAGLFEQSGLQSIADRIRTGKIAFSAEDQGLQFEMLTLGEWINRKAPALATSMGMHEKDIEAVKEEQQKPNGQPGYQLLQIGYTKGLLNKFYPACEAEKLRDVRRQVEEGDRFPLLENLLVKEPVAGDSASGGRKALKVLPVRYDHVDSLLLRVRLNGDRASQLQWKGVRTDEDAARLVNRVGTAVGKPRSFSARYDVFKEMGHGSSFIQHWDKDGKWGKGSVPYGKLIDALNETGDIECTSLAQHVVDTLNSGSVERELTSNDLFRLAELYRESNPLFAFSLLARVPHLERDQEPPSDLAHGFGVKCSDYNCGKYSGSYNYNSRQPPPKVCASYPSLAQKLQQMSVTPYQFKYPTKK